MNQGGIDGGDVGEKERRTLIYRVDNSLTTNHVSEEQGWSGLEQDYRMRRGQTSGVGGRF